MSYHKNIQADNACPNFLNKVHDTVLHHLENEEKKLDEAIESLPYTDAEELAATRKHRIDQLKKKQKNLFEYKRLNHGTLSELFNEHEFFEAVKRSKKLVVHFFRPSAWRCEIVDKKIINMASKHISIRFIKINAEKSPFLTERFKIWCIPTIMLVKNGYTSHSIVGLDELGGDTFTEQNFEKVLKNHHMIDNEEED